MFPILSCTYIPDHVVPIGSPILVEYTGINVIGCVFLHPGSVPRYDFLTLSALYAQTGTTNQEFTDEEFCYYYADAMNTYDPDSEPPLFILEYNEAFEETKRYMANIIENIVESKTHLQSIYFLKSLIQRGLDIEKITNLYEKLLSEEVEYRFLSSKAKIIQNSYKRAISDPSYNMCKRRLMREWAELSN